MVWRLRFFNKAVVFSIESNSIEEVLNFKIHDKIKINFKIDKAYAFHADGKLASSPFGGLNG